MQIFVQPQGSNRHWHLSYYTAEIVKNNGVYLLSCLWYYDIFRCSQKTKLSYYLNLRNVLFY